ncbi:MAG: tetratricopeptide repeat protein, partial [Methylomonas sp.]|nr:tetratricopeptide repeat protein [Methylomonas sp.]
YQQGNLDKAKTFLTKALEIDDKVAVTHYHLGLVYFKLNDKAKATEHLQRAVDSNIPFDGLDQAKKTLETLKAGG